VIIDTREEIATLCSDQLISYLDLLHAGKYQDDAVSTSGCIYYGSSGQNAGAEKIMIILQGINSRWQLLDEAVQNVMSTDRNVCGDDRRKQGDKAHGGQSSGNHSFTLPCSASHEKQKDLKKSRTIRPQIS
jgi:hypothetical protein